MSIWGPLSCMPQQVNLLTHVVMKHIRLNSCFLIYVCILYMCSDYHLGVPIGNITNEQIIRQSVNKFMTRVNMVKSHFSLVPPDTMYMLFKQYCMPLYGSTLWDLSDKSMELFYVSWRKSVRFLMGLPRTTHCNMLHEICLDDPVDDQLISRSLKFIRSLISSSNSIVSICAQIALRGSRSNVSNNITVVCKKLNIMRNSIVSGSLECKRKYICDESVIIRNLLVSRFESNFKPNNTDILNNDEIAYAIYILSTS